MSEMYLTCKTPGCHSAPLDLKPGTARALCEYRLRHDPKYVFRLQCAKCNKVTAYAYDLILSLIPPAKRPKPLPHDHFWAYILFQLDAWKGKDHVAFLGDRVLVQRLTAEPSGSWYGQLKSTSPYAPSLEVGNYLKGRPRGRYEVCLEVMEGQTAKPIPRPPQIPRSSSFGMFVSPRNREEELLGANIFCSNPSCHHIYSTMTYTKFIDMIGKEQLNEESYDEVTFQPTLVLECPVCGTERVIDDESFEGLYKERW